MQTQYEYKALASDGATLTGTLTAADTAQVEEYLQEHDLVPVSIAEARARSILSLPEFLRRTDYEKLILFTNSLSTMYRAGIPLLRSLRIMRIGKKNGPFNRALEQIRLRIQSGLQLSEAMEDFKELFSDVYRACITAGEESGKLDDTLIELSDMLEREQDLNRQVKSAVRYPVIVIVVICLAFFVLMTFVIPSFVDFYS